MQRPGFLPDRSARKRYLDVALASAILLAGAVPLALAAIVVRLSSGSPVLFRQTRVGRGVIPFVIYKLRTMHPAPDGPKVTVGGSARVTAQIHADGSVRSIRIESESFTGFGEACRKTLQGSRWSAPRDREGRAVATEIRYTCRFVVEP